MKNWLLIILSALLLAACEPDCDVGEEDNAQLVRQLIADAASDGLIVRASNQGLSIDGETKLVEKYIDRAAVVPSADISKLIQVSVTKSRIEIFGSFAVSTKKSALITCDLWGYTGLCDMTGTKGRALGKIPPVEDPTVEDLGEYAQNGSEDYPEGINNRLFFSNLVWENYIEAPNESALFGLLVANFVPIGKWVPPHSEWCSKTVGVHPERCFDDIE